MKNMIQPFGIRCNCYTFLYTDIAMRNYYWAKKSYDTLNKTDYENYLYVLDEIHKYTISTVVFSAMSIEAFFNNYAASCLGDEEFYDNFDKLSVISKFKLIAKFILKEDIDKTQSYYANLKRLIKKRDEYVHNKSKSASSLGCTEEELKELEEIQWGDIQYSEKIPNEGIMWAKEILDNAKLALMAVRDIAQYFDKYDANAHARYMFFGTNIVSIYSPQEKEYKSHIFQLLNIEESKDEV